MPRFSLSRTAAYGHPIRVLCFASTSRASLRCVRFGAYFSASWYSPSASPVSLRQYIAHSRRVGVVSCFASATSQPNGSPLAARRVKTHGPAEQVGARPGENLNSGRIQLNSIGRTELDCAVLDKAAIIITGEWT
jgi:hypothetical protein